jgi:hypothetical protein
MHQHNVSPVVQPASGNDRITADVVKGTPPHFDHRSVAISTTFALPAGWFVPT